MRKFYLFFIITVALLSTNVYAHAGIGTTTPNPSAMLEVASTNKGIIIPRVTLTGTADNTTVLSPQTSLLVYNAATAGSESAVIPKFYYWNGTSWINISTYILQQNVSTNGHGYPSMGWLQNKS